MSDHEPPARTEADRGEASPDAGADPGPAERDDRRIGTDGNPAQSSGAPSPRDSSRIGRDGNRLSSRDVPGAGSPESAERSRSTATPVPGGGETQGERFRLPNPADRRNDAGRPRPTLPGVPGAPSRPTAPPVGGGPSRPASARASAQEVDEAKQTASASEEQPPSEGPAAGVPARSGPASVPRPRTPTGPPDSAGSAGRGERSEGGERPWGGEPVERRDPDRPGLGAPAQRPRSLDAPTRAHSELLPDDTAALRAAQARERTRARESTDAPTVANPPLGPARVQPPAGEPTRAAAAAPASASPAGRRTTQVRRLGLGSVFKVSLAFYFAVFLVMLALSVVLWLVLSASGVISNVESFFGELLGYEDFRFLGSRILQIVVLVGLLWVVTAAAVTSLLAFLYNRISRFVGGITMTVEDVDD